MPTLRRLNRERGLDRDRVRPTTPGNFITLTNFGSIYYLLYQQALEPQKYYELYESPYPKAYGYHDEPPLDPPLRILGASSDPQDVIPSDILTVTDPGLILNTDIPLQPFSPIIAPTPFEPPAVAPGVSSVTNVPNNAGQIFVFVPGTIAKQYNSASIAITEVIIKADEDNLDDVWISYNQQVNRGNGFRLVAGGGIVLAIKDLSSIYFIAFNSTDSVQIIYNT